MSGQNNENQKDIDVAESLQKMRKYATKKGHQVRKAVPVPKGAKGMIAGKPKDIM
ncbi:hypothetical protein [Hahella ganghwensis]|uniref:hypothetical protein n=1 Tax=Hahella ganghwensis TaxID=286420 RepID=UPI00035DB826|nr:hypothetical protein [Hahella ganghwensis]